MAPSSPDRPASHRLAAAESPTPAGGDRKAPQPPRRRRMRRLMPLPLGIRIGLFLIGWMLVLVGVAGLVLPGIQGILTLFLGAAVLSLVSELVYSWLRALLHRWPGVWRRVEGLRLRLHRRLRRRRKP